MFVCTNFVDAMGEFPSCPQGKELVSLYCWKRIDYLKYLIFLVHLHVCLPNMNCYVILYLSLESCHVTSAILKLALCYVFTRKDTILSQFNI